VVAAAHDAIRDLDRARDVRDGVALVVVRAHRRFAGLVRRRPQLDGDRDLVLARDVDRLLAPRGGTAAAGAADAGLVDGDVRRRARAVASLVVLSGGQSRGAEERESGYAHRRPVKN